MHLLNAVSLCNIHDILRLEINLLMGILEGQIPAEQDSGCKATGEWCLLSLNVEGCPNHAW